MPVPTRPFGASGLSVPILGLGAGGLGDPATPEDEVGRFLNEAVDLGVTLVDAARSYGLAEERIGRHLARRRREVVLSTKVGYGVPGLPDWTGACVAAGVDLALRTFRTDVLDVVHLHSCPLETLQAGEVAEALGRAVAAGKARVAAFSGENEALSWSIDSGLFGSVQTSVNVCDQRSLRNALPRAAAAGFGVLAKRPLANAPWRSAAPSANDDAAMEYRRRWRLLARELPPELFGVEPTELAVRFAAFAPGVSAALVGTRSLHHLRALADAVEKGPLPPALADAVAAAFSAHGGGWAGMV